LTGRRVNAEERTNRGSRGIVEKTDDEPAAGPGAQLGVQKKTATHRRTKTDIEAFPNKRDNRAGRDPRCEKNRGPTSAQNAARSEKQRAGISYVGGGGREREAPESNGKKKSENFKVPTHHSSGAKFSPSCRFGPDQGKPVPHLENVIGDNKKERKGENALEKEPPRVIVNCPFDKVISPVNDILKNVER